MSVALMAFMITVVVLILTWITYSKKKYHEGLAYAQTAGYEVSRRLNAESFRTNHKGGTRQLRCPREQSTLKVHYGNDYFSFFRLLGEASYVQSDKVSIAFVLRETPAGHCWYVADYRVQEDHRGCWEGFRHLMGVIAWPWLRCPRMFGLAMGTGYPKYLRWLSPLLSAVLVRFFIIPRNHPALQHLPERYRQAPLRVLDRSAQKELFIDGARVSVLHLCPRGAPTGSRGSNIDSFSETRPIMVMALPGEWEKAPLPPALQGVIVHNMFLSTAGFGWVGSGDL